MSSGEDQPSVYALLIGIDQYKHRSAEWPNLSGAVADMELVESFLLYDLRVPASRIRTLRNQEATRSAIVGAIEKLAVAHDIAYGGAILIYFAGHGASVHNKQAIVPCDAPPWSGNLKDVISDVKLSSLLQKLANAKGDNITVIFDCCHSASGTRGSDGPYTVRGVPLHGYNETGDDVPTGAARNGLRGVSNDGKFLHAGLSSHVLLAACGEEEEARERDGKGLFTHELIACLRQKGVDAFTYSDLIIDVGRLANDKQTPQCEGTNKHRKLFNSLVQHRGQPLHRISRTNSNTFRIENAGNVLGLTPIGSEFAVYSSPEDLAQRDSEALFYLEVDAVETAFCTAHPLGSFPPPSALAPRAVGLMTRVGRPLGDLRVHVPDDFPHTAVVIDAFERLHELRAAQRWMINPAPHDAAHLGLVSVEGGRTLAFEVLDAQIRALGLNRLGFTVPADAHFLESVLRAAAHFFWHLRRVPIAKKNRAEEKIIHQLRGKVEVHVHELRETEDLDEDLQYILQPKKNDIIRPIAVGESPRSWKVVADNGQSLYGIELVNKVKVGFFASALYFDCRTLEINELYGPAAAAPNTMGDWDAPLRPFTGGGPPSTLQLNYGNGGGKVLRFALEDGQDVDVGFVKLLVSNARFDMSAVEQAPLQTVRAGDRRRGVPSKSLMRAQRMPETVWDEVTLPVVQTREA
ncbi:hypothetical protein K488DRAFT_72058 [Vararia minispora EC-137]|uniref:Uncharacterized protein n=1 Tax=Vararia minispora EC-137 TaxID=1314806 RepID=A0ACB8QFG1_9AGAM|nr:hypothetical protein K488DRAFT_72058 [Vararia minispora EC-137]